MLVILCACAFVHAQFIFAAEQPQKWPERPLRVVVPFTPGSGTDAVARIVTERLGAQVGQTFVVENRPGAGGTIGMAVVSKANPDGYTILVHSSSYTVTPTTYPNAPYDTLRDFSGITPLANLPNVLIIAPSKGLRSVKDLVAAAKSKPGTLTYASAGAGSATQLNAERFRLGAGFEGVHVPFKGTPEALTAIMSGEVQMSLVSMPAAEPQIKAGKVKALGVTGESRHPALPEVPTMAEAGFPSMGDSVWYAVLVPAGTPRDVIARLNAAFHKALVLPATVERMTGSAKTVPATSTPEQASAYVRSQVAKWNAIARQAGVKAQASK